MERELMEEAEFPQDEQLMELIAAGDSGAFSILVHRHTRRFYALAYRVLLNQQDAEDTVQDAFLKLWNGKATWDAERGAKFTTWFYRIVYNQALDHLAKASNKKRNTFLDETMPSDEPDAHENAWAKKQSEAITEAMAELPERQRTAVTLFFHEELSQKEAADIMGITPKAVESLIGRAKQTLRERMESYA